MKTLREIITQQVEEMLYIITLNYKKKQLQNKKHYQISEDEIKKIVPLIKSTMTNISKNEDYVLSVPLTVDINVGKNWEEAH